MARPGWKTRHPAPSLATLEWHRVSARRQATAAECFQAKAGVNYSERCAGARHSGSRGVVLNRSPMNRALCPDG
jgi:hypothetical protein